ncbi:MAG: hypothetical protein AMXMBFR64_53480 [Myxococcales bacterium]
MSTRTQAILWLLASTALFAWTIIDFSLFKPILGALAAIYGILLIVKDRIVQTRVSLTPEELERYGERLSESTPLIVEELGKGRHVSVIAKAVKKEHDVPEDVTLRYIIALGRYQQGQEGRDRLSKGSDER